MLALPAAAAAETLADALEAAYDRNPTLVQQRYLQKERDESYVQARSQYGPTLNLQTDGGYQYQEQAGFHADQTNGRVLATVSQQLYTSGRLRGQVAAARANVRGGQEQLRLTEQQTVQNVVLVYAAVLRDEARLAVGRENVDVLRGQLRQNSKRQEKGDVTLTDVAQADSRLAAAELQLAALEASLAVSRSEYLEIVGHNPGTLVPLPSLGALPVSIDLAFDVAEANNPSLLGAKYTEQASSASAASARGGLGPSVSVSAQGIYSNRLLRFNGVNGNKEVTAGFTVTQPILSGGLLASQVRGADARNLADQAGIDVARRQALSAVTSAWSQLAAARTALVTGERQVESARAAFAGMSCEELNGLRSTIDTLNAEQELQSAELQLLQNRYQVYVSHAALLAAMGTLTVRSIASGVAVYDPEANFARVRYRGVTPLDFLAMGLDRIGSASLRRPLSADLTGANVATPEQEPPLPPAPGPGLTQAPLIPITQSQLALPDGGTARCPLLGPGPRR